MTRSTHLLFNGETLSMESFTGTVVASNETSNTMVRQDEYLQNVGGSWIRTPGAVHSTVVTTHKVWLKAADGSETEFDLSGVPLAMRETHEVSVVWIGKEGLTSSVIVGAINHTTKARYLLDVNKDTFVRVRVRKALKLKNPGVVQWLVGGAVFLLVVFTKGTGNFLPGLLIGFVAALATEVLLAIFAMVTSLPVGQYGRGRRLMEQLRQIVETRVDAMETGSLVVGQPA